MWPSLSSRSIAILFSPALARHFVVAVVFVTLAGVGSFAQIDRAVLEGTVTDPSGAVIRSAKVQLLGVDTGISQEQATNSNGYYYLPGLAVGRYKVTVSSSAFTTKVVDDVVLQVGQTRTLNIQMEVRGSAEMVEVEALDEPQNRSSAEASTVIRTDQIANLPNNGRDWASFTLLAPFAQDDGGGDQRTIRFAGRARAFRADRRCAL